MADYTVVLVQKNATVHKCERCGCIVLDRLTHDVWHALINDAVLQEMLGDE